MTSRTNLLQTPLNMDGGVALHEDLLEWPAWALYDDEEDRQRGQRGQEIHDKEGKMCDCSSDEIDTPLT